MPVASFTSFIGDHSISAIFALMVAAAVVPAASELVMIYGGALASGALAAHVHLFGHELRTPAWAYLAVAVTGVIGNTVGAGIGWAIGVAGGRRLVERHGRWFHVDEEKLERTERWLERRGSAFVVVGFAVPLLRSFVAVPAGIARMALPRFLVLAGLGCAAFCFGLAGGGWALGRGYARLHHDLRYVEIAVVAGVLALAAYWVLRRVRSTRLAARAPDSPR